MSEEENTEKENFYFNEKNGKIVTTTTTLITTATKNINWSCHGLFSKKNFLIHVHRFEKIDDDDGTHKMGSYSHVVIVLYQLIIKILFWCKRQFLKWRAFILNNVIYNQASRNVFFCVLQKCWKTLNANTTQSRHAIRWESTHKSHRNENSGLCVLLTELYKIYRER